MKQSKSSIALLFFITMMLIATQCNTPPKSVSPEPNLAKSNDGLIFYSERAEMQDSTMGEFGGLYFVDLTTREEKLLTEAGVVSQYDSFSWSPINKKLIYTQMGNDKFDINEKELFLLDLNGNKIQLTNNNVNDSGGVWSPDGQTIAFWSNQFDTSSLYLMDPDGSDVRPVFGSDYESILGFSLAWSPDSQKLAVSAVHSYTYPIDLNNLQGDLQLVDLASKEILPPLPTHRARNYFSWSPDSNKLVYLSDPINLNSFQTIYTTMYILDIRTLEETLIGQFAAIGTPHWSPIDNMIAFSASTAEEMDKGELNIYTINSDGTGLEQLTDDGFYRISAWSSNGNELAIEFIGEQLADYEIYVFDVETRTLERVTNNNVFDFSPIWIK